MSACDLGSTVTLRFARRHEDGVLQLQRVIREAQVDHGILVYVYSDPLLTTITVNDQLDAVRVWEMPRRTWVNAPKNATCKRGTETQIKLALF